MGRVLRGRQLGPDERIFGGKGILVPYRPRHDTELPAQVRSRAEPAINHERVVGQDPEPEAQQK
jgi:hypothetical protein